MFHVIADIVGLIISLTVLLAIIDDYKRMPFSYDYPDTQIFKYGLAILMVILIIGFYQGIFTAISAWR